MKFDDDHIGKSLSQQYPQFLKTYQGSDPIFKVLYHVQSWKEPPPRCTLAFASTTHSPCLILGLVTRCNVKSFLQVKRWSSFDTKIYNQEWHTICSVEPNLSDFSITGQFAPRKILCIEGARVKCDFLAIIHCQKDEQLTDCCLNIQSLNGNLEDLKADYLVTSCTVVLLCETWLGTEYPDSALHLKFLKINHLKG